MKASLEAEGIPFCLLGGVQPNPRSGLVYQGIELCRREGIDFVLAVGGGRPGTISGFVTLDEEDCTKIYQMMV